MRTWLRGKFTLLFMTCAVVLAIPAIALADEVANNLDNTVDATVENMNLTAGGANGSAKFYVVGTTQDDPSGYQGCNFKNGGNLQLNVQSSNQNVATVSPSQVTISDCGENNGAAISVTPVGQGSSTITVTKRLQSTVGGNFTLNTATFQVNVTGVVKQNQTISFGALPNKTFGDANFGLNATASSGLPVSYAASGNCAIAGANNDQVSLTGAGSCEITASQGGNATYNAATPVKQSFQIAKATPTIAWSNPQDITYGTALSSTQLNATAKGVDGNSLAGNFVYTPPAGTVLNAGTQSLSTTFTPANTANYNNANAQVQLVVGKADTTTKVTCTGGPFTYDGTAKTPCTAKVTGPNGLDQSVAVDYSNNTNAGTATASYNYSGTANYKPSSDSTTFAIGKANATIDVNGYTGTYDGTAHGASGTAKGVNDEDLSNLLNLGASFTNFPGGTANWSFTGNTNYNPDSGSVGIDISKASSTTTVKCPASVTYTGQPLTPCTVEVKGAGGLNDSPNANYTNNTNAGTATASYNYSGGPNHTGSSDSTTFVIDKANASVNITWSNSTYDGNANAASASVSGVGGANLGSADSLTYYSGSSVSGAPLSGAPKDAGTYTVEATFDGNANYKLASATKTITIAKANQTITFGSITNKIVGASFTVSASASSGLPVSFSASPSGTCAVSGNTVSVTGVGACTITASQAGDSNYYAATNVQQSFNSTYNFTGFASPVDNNNVLNSAKAGQAIPLKWRLTDASGNPVTDLSSVKVTASTLSCTLGTTTDLIEEYAAGASGLQNLGNGYYQFNWKSPTTYANSCKTLNVDMGEGATVTHTALFKFTK